MRPMKPTRRHVLALMACVPVAGALGAGGLGWRWWDRPVGAGLQCLSDDEHDFVQALAEAWMPPGGEPALSGADAELGTYLDGLFAASPERERKLLKTLMQALDDLTWPTHGAAYRHLPMDVRAEVLRGWLDSDVSLFRSAVLSLMLLLADGYGTHPQVVKHFAGSFGCGYGR